MMDEKELPKTITDALSRDDAAIAAELKRQLAEAAGPLLKVMDYANSLGFTMGWQAIAPTPPDGRNRIVNLLAIKTKAY